MSLKAFHNQKLVEAGCDEAGRGCLAGPVVAAAVILPHDFFHPLLNDSKQTSEKTRNILRPIIEKESIAFGIGIKSNIEIDNLNILKASILAMHDAVKELNNKPEFLLIDGNKFIDYPDIPHQCFVKGDSKYASIAAASILAKTYRDEILSEYHNEFPYYNWQKNKGYPTKEHREAIVLHGISKYHRKSFRLVDTQLKIKFPD